VVDTSREELVVVIDASVQFWKAAFLGMIWVIKQFIGLRHSLEKLRCALKKMGMIDPAGSPMKPARYIKFISNGEARAGSNELSGSEYLNVVPSYVITTEKDSSVGKKWREWSDCETPLIYIWC